MPRVNQKTVTHFPAAATAAVATLLSPGTDRRWRLRQITGSYSAAPTGGRLTVTLDPPGVAAAYTVLDVDILVGGPALFDFGQDGWQMPEPGDVVVTLASGAGVVVGKLTAIGIAE